MNAPMTHNLWFISRIMKFALFNFYRFWIVNSIKILKSIFTSERHLRFLREHLKKFYSKLIFQCLWFFICNAKWAISLPTKNRSAKTVTQCTVELIITPINSWDFQPSKLKTLIVIWFSEQISIGRVSCELDCGISEFPTI